MKFTLNKTSDYGYESEIEIDTLEELIDFIEEQGECIVIDKDYYGKNEYKIEIYDDYRE